MSDRLSVTLTLQHDYQMLVKFDQPADETLLIDEAPPLGESAGPAPSRVLAAAVASCLSASLLFCLRRSRIEVDELQAQAEAELERNEKGRLRIARINVLLQPTLSPEDADRIERCASIFEDFCTVTASVRQGIEVGVAVEPVVAALN